MNKNKILIIFFLLLALIVTLIIGTLCRHNKESFVNTKTCMTLSSDQITKASEMCNNLINSDPSGCTKMINAFACPIKGVPSGSIAAQYDASSSNVTETKETDDYAPFG